ncbi:hypothetical protein SPI_09149 [Niveomyces insectorum RCEF 264]|uniref:Uncharacterized protein n=1 Tax=Niveomyces insectorum RCEF 264 TaxID=1081102 RepID=A0A167M579_9HYPO|nr:hypothetical protein SPI_09149 [Niveomyces insectorum RCEF 264]
MSPGNEFVVGRSLPPSDREFQRLRHVESQLRRVEEHLGALSLSNANQYSAISQIHNIVLTSQNESASLSAIKSIIEKNVIAAKTVPIFTTRLSAGNATGSPSPPITSPESTFSRTFTSEDDTGSDGGSDAFGTKTSQNDSQYGRYRDRTALEKSKTIRYDKSNAEHGTKGSGLGQDTVGRKDDRKEAQINTVDEMWQEFSLEEELEGIADAPARDREAMRFALQEKENAWKKTLQHSAEEKRRIAERESLQIKRAISKPAPKLQAPVEILKGNQNSETPQTPSSLVDESDDDDDGEKHIHQPNSQQQPPNSTTETSSPSDILSIGVPSPKNASRFGVVFDPSRLDAASETESGGISDISGGSRCSVLIQNIPHDFTMHKLLAYVRGGTIVSAKLIPNMLSIGYGQTALITFRTAEEAGRCGRVSGTFLRKTGTKEGDPFDAGAEMVFSHLPTPTYPVREAVPYQGIDASGPPQSQRPTRCIVIEDFPRRYTHELCFELALDVRRVPNRLHVLEEMWFEGSELHIHYKSIPEAVKAHRIVSFFYFGQFRDRLRFDADPCAQSVGQTDRCDGVGQVASHGYMGLRSLIETVGLAAYSRSDEGGDRAKHQHAGVAKSRGTENWVKNLASLQSEKLDSDGNKPYEGSMLINISTEKSGNGNQLTPKLAMSTTPWTEDLMAGLDLL